MATSQIVPFAIAPGANVQDLATYTAAAATASGFASGVANSGALNRAWRQSSFMAAGLAGLLTANGFDVPDDGNLTNLVNNLKNLFGGNTQLQRLPGGMILQWGTAAGTASMFPSAQNFTFPTAFPNSVGALLGTLTNPTSNAGYSVRTGNITTTGAWMANTNGTASTIDTFSWIAIGR